MSEQSQTTDNNKLPSKRRRRIVAPLALTTMTLLGAATSANADTTIPKQPIAVSGSSNELEALTSTLQGMDDGGSAKIVDKTLELPGPIIGKVPVRQPIEFKSYGKDYLAYTSGNTEAVGTVPSPDAVYDFTIVRDPAADIKDRTVTAHMNKEGEIVNNSGQAAAFSIIEQQNEKQ